MNKAILVLDMPESCSKCKFSYEFQGIKKCHLLNALSNGGKAIIPKDKYTKDRHDECPLKEVPEKKTVWGEKTKTVESALAYHEGYNACIDEILGDKE